MIFVFEGPNGAGKSTQLSIAEITLKKIGFNVHAFRCPSSEFRDIALSPFSSQNVRAMIMAADRLHLCEEIHHLLPNNGVFLIDRFADSQRVYQKGVAYNEELCQWSVAPLAGEEIYTIFLMEDEETLAQRDDQHSRFMEITHREIIDRYARIIEQKPEDGNTLVLSGMSVEDTSDRIMAFIILKTIKSAYETNRWSK